MAPTTTANHGPTLAYGASGGGAPPPPQVPVGIAANLSAADVQNMQFGGLDQNQIMTLLRSLPGVLNKLTESGSLKEDAAQTLSNLAQAPFPGQQTLPGHYPPPGGPSGIPGINDPGPSSHPRGPPNLGQLSAVAMQVTPASRGQQQQEGSSEQPAQTSNGGAPLPMDASGSATSPSAVAATSPTGTTSSAGGRRGRGPAMGSDEWTRQRKDNHKEVERRRRGNINEGINELGRMVPNGSGEKAKGAILSRAVQYIHHLKENEARNIEKWTLEKLLMDQAMGDLQAQLEEVKRLWEEERAPRQRLESELEVLRGRQGSANNATKDESAAATKRRNDDEGDSSNAASAGETVDGERDGKRQRTE